MGSLLSLAYPPENHKRQRAKGRLVAPPFVWLATCGQKPVDRQIADQRPEVVAVRAAAGTAFPVRGRIGSCGCRRFKARRRFFAFGTIAPRYELSALYQAARQECDEFV